MKRINELIATFFYLGYSPAAPGTMGTLGGMLVSYLLISNLPAYAAVTILVTVAGFVAAGAFERECGKKDPGSVVVDEAAGVMIALMGLPFEPSVWITVFFLFRAFDMFKIFPANKLELVPGGTGIMMDDVVAGIYTNIVMQIALHLK